MSRAASALFLAAVAAACGQAPAPGTLLISIDSLRADHLSCYGYRSATAPEVLTTPEIDRRLADEGTRFERVVSTTSWTLPAHMAMLTGLPDELHGVRDQGDRLHPSVPTLAQSFARAGWRTAGFYSGPNVHPWFGFGRGFEVYLDCSAAAVANEAVLGRGGRQLRAVHDASHQGVTGPRVLASFERWLEEVDDGEPFFAFAHLWDVHYDYEAPPEHDVFFPGYRGPIRSGNHRTWANHWPFEVEDEQRILAMYDAEIRFTDQIVGAILDALEARGRLDTTVVALTSDHGEEFFEHGRFGHRMTLFEEVLRVPLVLRRPGLVPAGGTSDVFASLVDVAPTLLELSGLPRPEGTWGRSLVPALTGELRHRPAPLELRSVASELELRGWHDGGWKVLRDGDEPEPFAYRLDEDPTESYRRLSSVGPAAAAKIEGARAFWRSMDAVGADMPRVGGADLPAGLLEELIKNGYVDDTGEEE